MSSKPVWPTWGVLGPLRLHSERLHGEILSQNNKIKIKSRNNKIQALECLDEEVKAAGVGGGHITGEFGFGELFLDLLLIAHAGPLR